MGTSEIVAGAARFEGVKSLVLDSLHSDNSRRNYSRALDHFFAWWVRSGYTKLEKAAVNRYRASLEELEWSPSTINIHVTAVRRLAQEAADNGLLSPAAANAISRVKGAKRLGQRAGNWLSLPEAQALLDQFRDESPKSANGSSRKRTRDRAIVATLLGCGVRRDEAAELLVSQIQQRDGRWVILDLRGKGGRLRTVPMPSWVKAAIDAWLAEQSNESTPQDMEPRSEPPQSQTSHHARIASRLFLSLDKAGRITGESMTAQAIYQVVRKVTLRCGFQIAPHDLRRTFAKLAREGKADIEQIQLSLGHSSIRTTQLYLGDFQDLQDAPCDRLGIR